jgi:long-chain acyl-CoA synthetase
MDITPYLDLKIAPRAVFDTLAERRTRPRFMLPDGDDWRVITWGGFAKQIREAALFAAAAGLRSGERACVYAPNRFEWMSAALGIQAASGVIVPVYASSTTEQAAYVVEHSDARLVFVDTPALVARVLQSWSAYDRVERIVVFDEGIDVSNLVAEQRDRGQAVPPAAEIERKFIPWSRACAMGRARDQEDPGAFERTMMSVSLDQPGMMLYTSGTSGNPKGVPLTHRNVAVNGLDWLKCNAPLLADEGEVDLLWLPMSHIFGFGEACLGNTLGFTTYMVDPRVVLEQLPIVKPSVFMSVPSVWEKIATTAMAGSTTEARRAKLAETSGGRLRFCLSGGAGLKREVKEFLYEHGVLIIEGYGLTETSPTLTLNRPDSFRFDSVGKVLPSVELKLAEDGEILARGPSVFSGYHKDAAATKECFTPEGWFKTGDVGRFTDDGFLQIIDRKKDILVTAGGKNVPPQNIEQRFADDPYIAQVVVYGDGRKYLVAGVWLNDAAVAGHLGMSSSASVSSSPSEAVHALVQQRIEKVNAQLASYETIKRFAIMPRPLTVDGGLLTPTLKVKRKKVYETFKAELEALYG